MAGPLRHDDLGTSVRKLEFVEVRTTKAAAAAPANGNGGSEAEAGSLGSSIPGDPLSIEPRWSLWGDPDA
jgi:hypothetical protein